MNFSPEIKDSIKTLIEQNIAGGGHAARNVGRLDEQYHKLEGSSGWKSPKRGRFGAVYKVLKMEDLQEVAVKEIELDFKTNYRTAGLSRQSHSVRSDSAATFDFLMACQEAVLQSSQKFRHPNIVRCYESWIEQPPARDVEANHERVDPELLISFINDTNKLTDAIRRNLELAKGMKFYIVMELYEENLEERYYNTTPSRNETIHIIHQIACALSFIHEKGYVHRDVKPRNILITGSMVALGDFGLCKRIEDGERNVGTVGTVPYNTAMDEYLASGFDIWSLGIIAFELFYLSESEIKPNEDQTGRTLTALVEVARNGPENRLKEYVGSKVRPKSMKKIIASCLKVSANDRASAKTIAKSPCFHGNATSPTSEVWIPTGVAGLAEK